MKYVFGPVPSRRLGRSLGVNNIPPKYCSYSCIYCQLGRTLNLTCNRREFYPWNDVVNEVINSVKNVEEESIDYITFVPDGEPTLDINLGLELSGIRRKVNKPLAVLTNGSLLFKEDVRQDLYNADLISIKIDAVEEITYRRVNRPYFSLHIERFLESVESFMRNYKGKVITETMLVKNVNDNVTEIEKIAKFIKNIRPYKAYIAVPIRPPAETWVKPASEETILKAYNIFCKHIGQENIELLIGYEGPYFEAIKDPIESLLAITSVHPLRLDYAYAMLEKYGLDSETVLRKLIRENKIVMLKYKGRKFIMRKIISRS